MSNRESKDDVYDTQLVHEYHQPCEPQMSSWCMHCSNADNDPAEHSASGTVMSSTSKDITEASEGEVNAGLRQTDASHSMERRLPSQRHDYGRLQTADDGRTNALNPVLVVIDRGVRNVISFARQLPGFNTLIVDDQICLIKRQFATISLPVDILE